MRESENYENSVAGHGGAGAVGMAMPRTPSEQTELCFEATRRIILGNILNRLNSIQSQGFEQKRDSICQQKGSGGFGPSSINAMQAWESMNS